MKATVWFSRPSSSAATTESTWRLSRRAEIAWLVGVVLVAAILRVTDLPAVPPGVSHDEAM
ncbi:MAG: hypothetical protein NZ518_05485, partial [Dehalococcoidia bacterium]|nr:hypothetical protein [Dehalococcoidia bacterium]